MAVVVFNIALERAAKRMRQSLCRHDWSCRWSRRCTGDHRCVKCGWAPAKAPDVGTPYPSG